jgi:hypothetical protein
MSVSALGARWRSLAPYLLSLLRIVSAFLFMQFGTAKWFAFPAADHAGRKHSVAGCEVEMRKLIAMEWMSLDGVVEAPAYPDEDASGGFKHGGWHLRYFEDVSMTWVVENVTQAGGFVFGRRTYDKFAAYWPKASSDGEQALAEPLNAGRSTSRRGR